MTIEKTQAYLAKRVTASLARASYITKKGRKMLKPSAN